MPPRREPGGLLKSFAILRDPRCSLCVGMILCSACATYVVYTYLSPILTDTLGLPEGAVSPLLLVMGACSAASNLLSGALGERGGRVDIKYTLDIDSNLSSKNEIHVKVRPRKASRLSDL